MIELKHERERRGWTLEDVAERTRIPLRYLEALEDGDHEVLPPGPFFRGYFRQYLEFLGQDPDAQSPDGPADEAAPSMDEDEEYPSPIPPREEVPLIRLVMTGFFITLLVVLTLQLSERLIVGETDLEGSPAPTSQQSLTPPTAPQKVRIHAAEDVNLRVMADEEIAFSGVLPGSETKVIKAHQRIALEIGDLRWVTIHYNGERIEPLGNLSKPRRIVFIHDRVE